MSPSPFGDIRGLPGGHLSAPPTVKGLKGDEEALKVEGEVLNVDEEALKGLNGRRRSFHPARPQKIHNV